MYLAKNFIDGAFLSSSEKIDVINPATEEICGKCELATLPMAEDALQAAARAASVYRAFSLLDREHLCRSFRSKLLDRKKELIDILILETGKTRDNASYDFGMLTGCLDFFIEEVKRRHAPVIQDYEGGWFHYLKYEPIGVMAAFLTWNFPLLNLGYKLAPALAAGNASVIKPASETPLATALVAEIFSTCGFPKGTLNIVHGDAHDLGKAIASSKIPRLLTMIGSTFGGLKLLESSTTSIKRFSLELGGNAPALVFKDADIKQAASSLISLKFSNAGQICVAPNRVFVHGDIYKDFLEECKRLLSAYHPLGSGGEGPEFQPIISQRSLNRILALMNDAVREGGKIVAGGARLKIPGYFLEPTLIAEATPEMKVCSEEIFGPVMPTIPFTERDDIFSLANQGEAGLAAYVFTENLDRIFAATEKLKYGNILIGGERYSVQLPHGGLKQSGFGKDASHLALDDYFDVKRISIKHTPFR